MWIFYVVNLSLWILGCHGYAGYYNPAPIYSTATAYRTNSYNNAMLGNTVPNAVQDVAKQLLQYQHHNTVNNGLYTRNTPTVNNQYLNYLRPAQNQYSSNQYAKQYPQQQYSYNNQYPKPTSSAPPQYNSASHQTLYAQQPNIVQNHKQQMQYQHVQQPQMQYPSIQSLPAPYPTAQPQMHYPAAQPTAQPRVLNNNAVQPQVLQSIPRPINTNGQGTTLVQQVNSNNYGRNTLVKTQYDPRTNQFLSSIKPLMEPQPSVHPTNPSLYFVMPNNMLPQYPNAVVVARGEPQPGYSIVKWSPGNQATQQQTKPVQKSNAKMYDYYDNQYQYNYDGSDYDYISDSNSRYGDNGYEYDDYYEQNYDYDDGDDYYQARRNVPARRSSRLRQGQGQRGRYSRLPTPRRRIYSNPSEYRRNRSRIPMYMRFAKAFGPKYGKASSSASRSQSPQHSYSKSRSPSRYPSAARSRSRSGARSRSRSSKPVTVRRKVEDVEEGGLEGFVENLKDKNVKVVYEYEYTDEPFGDEESDVDISDYIR